MRVRHFCDLLLASAGALALSACGGGGGRPTAELIPTPPITPPPAPAPTSTTPAIFPNVTTATEFAALGYESPGPPIQPGSLIGSGFAVSYDGSAYYIDVPALESGPFDATTTGDRYWNGQLTAPSGFAALPISLNVFRPGAQNWDFPNLTYTTFAEYSTTGGQFGELAFGQATPASAMPVAGSAAYSAFAAGQTNQDLAIRGDVTLQFDFGNGTLSGFFDPYIYDLLAGNHALGHYEFVNTVYGVGSTTYSGELSRSGMPQHGSFNGSFTGPNAEELMGRWIAPLPDANNNVGNWMFGVWVGRKH